MAATRLNVDRLRSRHHTAASAKHCTTNTVLCAQGTHARRLDRPSVDGHAPIITIRRCMIVVHLTGTVFFIGEAISVSIS